MNSETLNQIDGFLASFQRPFATYVLTVAVAFACFRLETATLALPLAGAVIGGNIAARSVDKNTEVKMAKVQTGAVTDDKQIAAGVT